WLTTCRGGDTARPLAAGAFGGISKSAAIGDGARFVAEPAGQPLAGADEGRGDLRDVLAVDPLDRAGHRDAGDHDAMRVPDRRSDGDQARLQLLVRAGPAE